MNEHRNILLTFESFLVDTFDVVVVQLENTQIRKTGDGARGDAGDLVVGQVPAMENNSPLLKQDIWRKLLSNQLRDNHL